MRIKKLAIRNFRSLQDLEMEVPRLCALVGPNNAGKSNILQAIHRVLGRDWVNVGSFSEEDVFGHDPERDISIEVTIDPPIEYSPFKYGDPTELQTFGFTYTRYKVGEQRGERRLDQAVLDPRGKPAQVLAKAPQKNEQRQYKPLTFIPAEVRERVPVIYIGTHRSLKEHLPGAQRSLLRQLLEDVNRDFHRPQQTVTVRDAAGAEKEVTRVERFGDLMRSVTDLLRTEDLQKLERDIKENALRHLGFDPVVDAGKLDFYFAPFETLDFYKALDVRVKEEGFEMSATELGEGFQNAIVLAILQAFERRRKQGAVILIEEPEMFLHPQMQRSLYRTLRRLAETNQVVYATHSPHFVSVPNYEEVLLVRRDPGGTMVTASTLPTNEARREKLVKELDPERNELFFATRLLLVEGDTEKLALPVYAERMGLDLDRAGATIVEVGGKRNLPEFMRIAESFGIPTGVLYDEDSSEFKDRRDEEKRFNTELDEFETPDGLVRVWRIPKDYEEHLRKTLGEEEYQRLCQSFPGVGKPTQARLIAQVAGTEIPERLEQALRWVERPDPVEE